MRKLRRSILHFAPWRKEAGMLLPTSVLSVLAVVIVAPTLLGACGGSDTVTATVTRTDTVTETAAPGPGSVFTPNELGQLLYKPTTIEFLGAGMITDIRWSSYGGPTAVGKGILRDSPTPGPVTVTLRHPEPCGDKPVYMEWRIGHGAASTDGKFNRIMSAHTIVEACG